MMIRTLKQTSIVTLLFQVCLINTNRFFGVVIGQSTTNGIDEDLITRQDDSIDFPGCFLDIAASDRDGDGFIKQNEYLGFVQTYGRRICFGTDELTLQQSATFNTLACICRQQEGQQSNCCLGENARIPTAGSLLSEKQRSPIEQNYLTSVCKLTDATIDAKCPPIIDDRGEPAVTIQNLNGPVVAAADDNGLPWWVWLLIAMAIILLLCCCCGFVLRRRRAKEDEEAKEIEEDVTTMNKEGEPYKDPEQPALASGSNNRGMDSMNNAPPSSQSRDFNIGAAVAPLGAVSAARGATVGEDSDDEEDARKRVGGGRIVEPDDDELVGYRGAPRLPPPENPPQPPHKLRPIDKDEEEDNEWDQPGRNIEFPVEKDDISAGEVDHYEPDGGVHRPQRPTKDPLYWKSEWNRARPDDPDETDKRKHRIQSGLGEGAVWDELDASESEHFTVGGVHSNDVDWVMASAIGALDADDSLHAR
jgi:hypothetical protein